MEDGSPIRTLLTAAEQPFGFNTPLILNLLFLFILILIHAFFAAAEISIITLNDNQVRKRAEEGDRVAQKLVRLISEPGSFLATIKLGVTLAGFLAAVFAAEIFAGRLYRVIGIDLPLIRMVSMIVVTVILVFFSLLLGELVPKRIAQRSPEKLANGVAGLMVGLSILMKPFVSCLTCATNLFLRILGIDPSQTDRTVTEEEIRMMVDVGRESGNIHEEEKEMINKIFEFNDKEVSEIMTHRTNIVSLDVDADYAEVLEVAIHEKYTRIPVFDDNIDNIVGILHIKDLLYHAAEGLSQPFSLRNMIRPPYFVPESKNIDSLFREMQRDRIQMAVAIDEYGGTAGIVTIEDLLEEIVGNIQDEYDEEEQEIIRKDELTWLIDGLADLDEVGDALGIQFPDDDFETLGGFIISLLGRIPEENELPVVTYEQMQIKVLAMEEKRVSKVEITVQPAPDGDAAEEDRP